MELLVVEKQSDSLAEEAADYLFSRIRAAPHFCLGLAAGMTPLSTYEALRKRWQQEKELIKDLFCFHLDEYAGMAQDDPRSFVHFLKTNVVGPWQLEEKQIRFWKGKTADRAQECHTYETAIRERGGIDCQILGLGMNGHIGFNEPGSLETSRSREVALTQETLKYNKKHLTGGFLPTHALTMGIATIVEAKNILLLVSGKKKKESFKRFLKEEPNVHFPATFLKRHRALTVICDKEAIDGFK